MKPTVRKLKDARRRIIGYVATYGTIESTMEKTAASAVNVCEAYVWDALARLDRSVHVMRWNGHTLVVAPDINGWRYWIDTFDQPGYFCYCGREKREDVMDAALSHLADNVWTHEVNDEEYLALLPERMRREKRERYQWYRDMKAFMDAGYSDDDSRRMLAEGTRPGAR